MAGHAPARRPGIRPVAPPEPKRFTPDYNYVASELRRIALFLGGILVVLVVLAIFLR